MLMCVNSLYLIFIFRMWYVTVRRALAVEPVVTSVTMLTDYRAHGFLALSILGTKGILFWLVLASGLDTHVGRKNLVLL